LSDNRRGELNSPFRLRFKLISAMIYK